MSQDDQIVVVSRTRRALNNLQTSPNGKGIAGSAMGSPRKSSRNKKVLFDETSKSINSLKRRQSISLPDICSFINSKDAPNLNKSATSTPHKLKMSATTNATVITPIKFSKTNISIIVEEKENPNYSTLIDKQQPKTAMPEKKEFKEIAIQCNKSDEDMLTNESVEGTNYWKLVALKRTNALIETRKENSELHKSIDLLDEKNESLRKNIKDLYDLIAEYQEIKKSMIELSEENEEDDSGYTDN